jgi:hypothetical protein
MTDAELYLYTGQDRHDIPRNVRHVKVDSSVTQIPDKAFKHCELLSSVILPEGIQQIGTSAFQGCRVLKVISVPSSCVEIQKCAFAFCYDLTSVEVSEGLRVIGDGAFHYCVSLVNIALPTSLSETSNNAFAFCAKLHQHFSADAYMCSALTHRFDNLPIHKLCYNQACHPTDADIEELYKLIDESDGGCWGKFDCFGMTPLHVLALSGKPRLNLFSALLGRRLEDLMAKDQHGNLPIHYICSSNAPLEIFQLALDTQRSAFPHQQPDWKTLVWITETVESYKYVVHSSIESRVSQLGLKEWRADMLNTVSGATEQRQHNARPRHLRLVHSKLIKYERLEMLSLLELALWKTKLDQVKEAIEAETRTFSDEQNIDSIDRWSCRINSGDEVIISSVLPFLGDY